MALSFLIKVYNKDGKVKMSSHSTDTLKIVNIYKYEKDIKETHSFTYLKSDIKKRFIKDEKKGYSEISVNFEGSVDRGRKITYYDYSKIHAGIFIERLWISDIEMEHWEVVGDKEEIKIIKKFDSGNVYEERKKVFGKDILKTEFKNGEMTNFEFTITENKINEYLEKLQQDGK